MLAAVGAAGARAAAAVLTAAGVEAGAGLVGEAAALLGGWHHLGHEELVLRPLHRDLLADELLDRLDAERARFVDQRERLAAGAGPRRPADPVDVVLRV